MSKSTFYLLAASALVLFVTAGPGQAAPADQPGAITLAQASGSTMPMQRTQPQSHSQGSATTAPASRSRTGSASSMPSRSGTGGTASGGLTASMVPNQCAQFQNDAAQLQQCFDRAYQ